MGGKDYTGSWFHIECSESDFIFNTPGDNTTPNDGEDNEEEEWKDAEQYPVSDSNQMCFPTSISNKCKDGFNINKSKCEPDENTRVSKSEAISNGKGWNCEFTGNNKPISSEVNMCYPPSGTLYIDCIPDPDYVSIEDQIEQKKKEIEGKYPDLNGAWMEYPIMCPEWNQNCNEASGAAECGMQKNIKDGFCFPIEPTKLLNPPGEIFGNGWHCDFGNTSNPEGKSFAYCVSE